MRTSTRLVAAIQLALIFPATLFLTAVLVAAGDQPPKYDLARFAQMLVDWYSAHSWTPIVLLLTMPLASLVAGGFTLRRTVGNSLAAFSASVSTLLVGWATITSVGILGVVALHVAAN